MSGKLLLLFLTMAVLFVVLVGASIQHVFSRHFEDNIRPHLVQYLEYVQQDIGRPPNPQRARALAQKLNLEIHIIDGQRIWSSRPRKLELEDLEVERRFVADGIEYALVEADDQEYLMTRSDGVTLLFNVPHARQEEHAWEIWPLAMLLAILSILYVATQRLVSPLRTIEEGVHRFGAGALDHRIHVRRRDEFGDLAATFNAMADDIRQMLDAKRQLLLAISHELRTPLTRAKVSTELLDDEARKAAIHQELDEMEALIEELMETERLSTRHRVLNKTANDLVALVRDVIAQSATEAEVSAELPAVPLYASIDAARIKLLLKNLIGNALRYTPPGSGAVRVRLSGNGPTATLRVEDHGPGIDPVHLPHLTEPFYRVDPARQRETGGFGLGLYLCKMIAEAHGGTLRIASTPNVGTVVWIELPLGETDTA